MSEKKVENLKQKLPLLLIAVSILAESMYREVLKEKTNIDVPPM